MVSTVKLGSGQFAYEVVVDWETLPAGVGWREVAGVITDADDNVYVFSRGDHPMVVFDRDGNFIKSWGEAFFTRPHGVSLGPDNTLYCTDDGDHTVRQCTLDGEILMTIGVPNEPSGTFSGEPFNRCTHVATDPATAICSFQTAMATVASTSTARTASRSRPGVHRGPIPVSSTSSTTSPPTGTAMSTSATGRTTASRSSTAMAASKTCGTTSTGPARST